MALATLTDLPTELFSHIISFLPVEVTQSAVLALTRAAPLLPIPLFHLFEHILISKPSQVVGLYQRLRKVPADVDSSPRNWIRTVTVASFEVDADVCINLLNMVRGIERLTLHVGPKNFSPEHLEDLFDKPFYNLQCFALRFRPYLQQVNHYQFLKGAYFDSVLKSLARWPEGSLPLLSIVQDPLDPQFVPNHFAQPMVFFQLEPFASLIRSGAAANMASFRLRIPSRQIVRSLVNGSVTSIGDSSPAAYSSLNYLDLSSCNVLEGDVESLLTSFFHVEHLVLDSCAILKGELREGEWAALGKKCALVGVSRARAMEKRVKTMFELLYAQSLRGKGGDTGHTSQQQQVQQTRRQRRGRRGVATATISLREPSNNDGSSSAALGLIPQNIPAGVIPKVRVLPPLPSLKTFCTTVGGSSAVVLQQQIGGPAQPILEDNGTAHPATLASHLRLKHAFIRAEFAKGWEEGMTQLNNHRLRLKGSWRLKSSRVMRFTSALEEEEREEDEVSRIPGLADILEDEEGMFELLDGGGNVESPVVCLAGADKDSQHSEGCGHSVGWCLFHDVN
ncbi:hypothetical protein DL96DRAFT_1572684 [Flagelloscypha sp. PMI_526]|nr:hypothetical protein DL96DRAFT_1572684 [Flagelloscypha sp. PMI_526]